jgi:pimeloyl-ACP methyl ester carboxylesterase
MTRLRLAGLALASSLLASSCATQRPPSNRVVDLAAPDGAGLKATYFAAAAPGPGVLLLHQCNRQRKVWDALAQQLAVAGLNVLTLDLRGFGESSGARFDMSAPTDAQALRQKWPTDIDVAFQHLSWPPARGTGRGKAPRALELLASDTSDPPARRTLIRESAEQKLTQLGMKPK